MDFDPNGNIHSFKRCIAKRCRSSPEIGTPEGCYCQKHFAEREERLEREYLLTIPQPKETILDKAIDWFFDYGNE